MGGWFVIWEDGSLLACLLVSDRDDDDEDAYRAATPAEQAVDAAITFYCPPITVDIPNLCVSSLSIPVPK